MLTKDLLKCSVRSGKVYPANLKPDDEEFLGIAERIITIFVEHAERRRAEIEGVLDNFIRGCRRQFEAKGFRKLLFDRCDFEHLGDCDYAARRSSIFAVSAELYRDGSVDTPELLKRVVLGEDDQRALYADLPENERLAKFRTLTPIQLIHRYNIAQIQGLLFSASSIVVRTNERNAANLRRVFKFLKFFRLLSRTFREADESLRIEIDGPLSILESSRSYGLQLASYFPAICLLKDWSLTAEVTAKKKQAKLELNQDAGLVSHYRHWGAYVPEEVAMFAKQFKKKGKGWTINPNTPFLNLGNGEIVFPDFTFESDGGEQVYLELFHRWHRGSLLARLRLCIAKGDRPLILGIDRSLMSAELQELLDTGLFPEHRYFLFRDYPTVTKVQKCLNGFGDLAKLDRQKD